MATVSEFNRLKNEAKKEALLKCCGSSRWAERLITEFPFDSLEDIKSGSDRIWFSLNSEDWKEAFGHHPKIGDAESLKKKFAATSDWASQEQSGTNNAADEILEELKQGNDEYEKKFGFIFIVCATGKSAEEMLDLLKKRLINNPAYEIRIAAEEQNKITHLRLEKLFS